MTDLARTRGRRTATPRQWLGRALVVVLIVFFVAFFIIPVVWLVLAPTKSPGDLQSAAPFAFGSFPDLAANWDALFGFQNGVFVRWLGNSTLYSFGALIIALVVSIPAGYALALVNFKGRKVLLMTTLIVMLIPNTALVLPIFLELSAVKLIGTPLAVILPFSFFPFGVYLTYIYFSTAVSRDLLDAARMDGAGELRVFAQVAMPLATPVIALVGFFNFTGNWNNYFLPFLMVGGEKVPVQVGLANMLSNVPQFNPTTATSTVIEMPTLALATLLSVAPILVIFLFSQRFLVEGMTAGGNKGMTVRRFGFVVNVVPEKREEYLELHRNVWPEVEAAMSGNGMRNYSIFVIDNTLFGYWEYAGEDFDADMARIAADPASQRWWQLTDPCQTPFGTDRPTPTNREEIWREMELAWHLD